MELKEISPRIYDERQLRAITGLSLKHFILLLEQFKTIQEEFKAERYKGKTRKAGSGQNGKLNKPEEKLLFILHYLKCYPTFDQLGFTFYMDNSSAAEYVKNLLPILMATLNRFGVLPKTEFNNPEEMRLAFSGLDTLLIDATERVISRPQDNERQREHFSGKKRQHTYKNTVIASLDYLILYIGLTFSGKNHDYGMFKKEFNGSLDWFSQFTLFVDLGYLGITKQYKIKHCAIPHKKLKKSKNNPAPKLTKTQKDENKLMSQKRIIVEHVIGGMKRYRCLVDRFRSRRIGIEQVVIVLAAGLWNFHVLNR